MSLGQIESAPTQPRGPSPNNGSSPHFGSAPHSGLPPEPQELLDLRDYMELILAGRWTIILVAALSLGVATGWAFLSTPIYEAQTLIQVEDQRTTLPGFEIAGLNTTTAVESEIEILRSRFVLGQVVDQLDLVTVVEPIHFPVVGPFFARRHSSELPASAPFGAASYAWGGEFLTIDRLEVAPHLEGQKLTLVAGEEGRYRLFDEDDGLILEGRVDQLAESPSSADNPAARLFVSRLVARPGTSFRVVKRSRLRAISALRQALSVRATGGGGFLEVTLSGSDPARICETLDAIALTYLRQHVERGSAEARSSLQFLDSQLPELRVELEAAEELYNEFRRDSQAVDLTADTQNLLSRIVSIESQIAQLDLQIIEEGQRFGDQHPRMQTLRGQRSRMQSTKANLEAQVETLPDREQEALRLRREVEVATHLYTNLLNSAQELRVVQAGTIGNVRIVDPAVTGEEPVKPRRKMTLALSLALGLMLGVGLVFFRQSLSRAVEDPDALEAALGLSVYSVIPHSREEARLNRSKRGRNGHIPLLARLYPRDPAVEGLRSFRTSLHFALTEPGCSVVLITSPDASSGKSFVSMNIGQVFADAGERVIIIDGDMRRGRLHEQLGFVRENGLAEVLAGKIELDEAIEQVEEGFDLITTGAIPPNPSELLMRPTWEQTLSTLRERYDLIFIDTPPILAVTDAAIMGAKAQAVFLLVRAGKSRLEEIETSVRRLTQNGQKVTGLLFNDIGARNAGYSAHRYQHYYRYEYTNRQNKGDQ